MGLLQMLVRLGLDATGYEVGMKRARSSAHEFGSELAGELGSKIAGAFSLAALEEGMRRTVEFGSKIQDLSTRTGISTDDLQIFDFAAQKAGTTLDSVSIAVEKLAISMAKAKAGNEDSRAALQRLGIQPEQLGVLEAAEAFKLVGDRIKNVSEITGDLQADMKETMGKGALEVLAVLRDDVRATGEELRSMGGVISPEQIAQLDEFDDNLKVVWVNVRSFFADIFTMVSAVVTGFINLTAATIEFGNAVLHLRNPFTAFQDVFTAAYEKESREWAAKEERKKKGKRPLELDDKEQQEREKKAQAEADRDEQRDIREAARIRENVAKKLRENRLEELTDAEKLKQLNTEMDEAWKASIESRSDLERAKADERFQELDSERRKIEKHQKGEMDKEFVSRLHNDSFVSIGNIIGTDPNRPVVDKLEVLHGDLREIVTKINGGSTLGGSTYPTS